MVDLYLIGGIGSEYTEILEEVGVDTVPDPTYRNPANRATKLTEVDELNKSTRRVPTEKEVTRWVAEVEALPE